MALDSIMCASGGRFGWRAVLRNRASDGADDSGSGSGLGRLRLRGVCCRRRLLSDGLERGLLRGNRLVDGRCGSAAVGRRRNDLHAGRRWVGL